MIERSMARAESGRLRHCAVDVVESVSDARVKVGSGCESGDDGRGERTTSAMRGARFGSRMEEERNAR